MHVMLRAFDGNLWEQGAPRHCSPANPLELFGLVMDLLESAAFVTVSGNGRGTIHPWGGDFYADHAPERTEEKVLEAWDRLLAWERREVERCVRSVLSVFSPLDE